MDLQLELSEQLARIKRRLLAFVHRYSKELWASRSVSW